MGGAGAGAEETPNFVVVGGAAEFVWFGGGNLCVGLVTADKVPVDRASHSADEYFEDLRLVGQCEAERVLGEGWRLLGNITYKAAGVGVVFAAYGRVGEGDDGKGDVIVYVVDYGEVVESWFDEVNSGGHCDVFVGLGALVVESQSVLFILTKLRKIDKP